MMHSHAIHVLSVAAGVVLTILGSVPASAATPSKTLDNLMAAYNGESNAHARYLAFATKADAEGFAGAASLYRAAAAAEETHARNHAEVITKLGGTPKADIKLPDINSTVENLKVALEGETYERDKMYPEFIAEARAAGNADAVRSFNFALAAEGEHAKLYGEASRNVEGWKEAKTFYVCPVCGKTVQEVTFAKCPVCYTEGDKYLKVS